MKINTIILMCGLFTFTSIEVSLHAAAEPIGGTLLGTFEENPEVIPVIAERLPYSDLVKLAQTSASIYSILVPEFERRNALIKYWTEQEIVPSIIQENFTPNLCGDVHFSPDGTKIVACDAIGTYVWDVSSGTRLNQFNFIKYQLNVAFSPDKITLVSSFKDVVNIWNIKKQTIIKSHKFDEGFNLISLSPDGKLLAIARHNGQIILWDIESDESKILPGKSLIRSLAFSPDGTKLASMSRGGSIIVLWDTKSAEPIKKRKIKIPMYQAKLPMVFSSDNETVAAGVHDNIILWNVRTDQKRKIIPSPELHVSSLSFSPDGMILASGSSDGIIRLWNIVTGKEIKRLDAKKTSDIPVEFSPDGKIIASARADSIILWKAKSISK